MYIRLLKVATPEGKRIPANIHRVGKRVSIRVDYLEVVEKDNPPFAEKGIIKVSCEQPKYVETINLLTQYLEDLFLKGMSDENIHTSLGAQSKPGGAKAKDTKRKAGRSKRERGTPGIQPGAGGDEPSEGTGRGYTNPEVAEISDPSTGGEDQGGD